MPKIKLTVADPAAQARAILAKSGFTVTEVRPIDHGRQFKLLGATGVNVYDSGAVVAHGREAASVEAAFVAFLSGDPVLNAARGTGSSAAAPVPSAPSTAVASLIPAAGGEEPISRRHPQWSDAPWDGVECPFDIDP